MSQPVDLSEVHAADQRARPVPTAWLLGKTGVGKSSLINAITNADRAVIGDAWRPCTRQVQRFDFPENDPVLRFLDTRGLGETGYDPTDDLNYCREHSDAVIVVTRLDSPEPHSVLNALRHTRRKRDLPMLLVMTHPDRLSWEERASARESLKSEVSQVWKQQFHSLTLDLRPADEPSQLDNLRSALSEILPDAALLMANKDARRAEQQVLRQIRPIILAHAGTAALVGGAPAVGPLVALAPQANMLRAVANALGVEWDRQHLLELTGALGTGFAFGFAGSTLLRSAASSIPVAGTALSAATGFAVTWALGEVASLYLFRKTQGESVSADELRALYKNAFDAARDSRR